MLDDTLPVTLQYQLRGKLLDKIEKRFWSPGSQIPSERELCDEYGVSRITVREVLKELVQEGYLVRKQGKGTFVSLPKFEHELTSSYSLSQELEKEGLDSGFQLLGFKRCSATSLLQRVFGISAQDSVYEITRLRFIGDELFAWERAFVPCSLMEGAGEEQLKKDGLYLTIFRRSGLMAEEAEVEAEAVNCPGEIAELLQIKKNTAVLRLNRLTTAKNRCIEYCESYIRSEKYKYKYKQTLRKKAFYDDAYSDQTEGK
ncbi:GntR family transcriptional regulator [Paenibacillus sp. J2TS4]|uniref:GntR family transcriptional regulator n=1 Tax=Paenibacillus sp. J2TS4 TaxID=2807194 RepID=UPI001B18BAC5|nr:GntR family transcriptional regulator [Paenibacillus sp. J2TS4]GIP33472.1 HTH-type transcriptional repressor YvoA [Paenibacillus sp. J2TS4]